MIASETNSLYLTRQHVRQIDATAIEQYGMQSLVLMENAGRGATDVLERLGIAGLVVICCGHGNNGGDGLVMARHLELRGHDVKVLILPPEGKSVSDSENWLSPDAAANWKILKAAGTPVEIVADVPQSLLCLQEADWIVDALLGTGACGEPRAPLDLVIDTINAAGKRTLAVDLPSGLDCDTGQPATHGIRASHTVTFVAQKIGFANPAAKSFTGEVHVTDIGIPRRLWEALIVRSRS
jgi:NAD(P)H-hydrate epimerase